MKEENDNLQIFREVLTNIIFINQSLLLLSSIFSKNLVLTNLCREYSREACVLECQIEQAFQRCRCYPWDYPFKYQDDNFSICDIYGNICFENVMKNKSKESCDVEKCPMDCNSISYSYSIVSTPFKEKELCSSKGKGSIFEEFYNHPFPPRFIARARTFFYNESSKLSDLCARYLPYRAEVTFRLATDTVSVTVRSRRLSFFDKLSAFGGILGLFTGMSILSVVEVAFWSLRYLLQRRNVKK